jgi:hypothetical protein
MKHQKIKIHLNLSLKKSVSVIEITYLGHVVSKRHKIITWFWGQTLRRQMLTRFGRDPIKDSN